MLSLIKNGWICRYGVPSLESYEWDSYKVSEQKGLGKVLVTGYLRVRIFGVMKNTRNSAVMVEGERKAVSAIWFGKVLV